LPPWERISNGPFRWFRMEVDVLTSPRKGYDALVLVDVFRSSTTIALTLEEGAKYILPCKTLEEALDAKRKLLKAGEDVVLAGERMGVKPDGFDVNISPPIPAKGKVVVYTSTNLVRQLFRIPSPPEVIIGALVNSRAVSDYVKRMGFERVGIVACGEWGQLSVEDFAGAGAIVKKLGGRLTDSAMLALLTYENDRWRDYVKLSSSYKLLESLGFERDLSICMMEDVSDTVPVLREGRLVRA